MARTFVNIKTQTTQEIPKNYTFITDPNDADINVDMVDDFNGVVVTQLTLPTGDVVIAAPTILDAGKRFTVVNEYLSPEDLIIEGIALPSGTAITFIWDSDFWTPVGGVATASNGNYAANFLIADFVSESITIPASIHKMGSDPIIQIYDGLSAPRSLTMVDDISVASNGDITFSVSVGFEFNGRIVVSTGVSCDECIPPNYTQLFNNTTDWGVASGGLYTISIPQTTHLLDIGSSIDVIIQEDLGASWAAVQADSITINKTTGDVEINVTEIPDSRFTGRVIVK